MIPYATNADIALYQDGVNITWNQENARKALRWERRLEFAMEGSRFFDLVRWGIADQVLNDYFTKNKNEYIPIPQNQIGYVKGIYKQNAGF